MESLSARCFHCHGPLPPAPEIVAADAEEVRVCSPACATTVRSIHAAGLDDFYRHRDTPLAREDDGAAPVSDWETYERPALMREYVRTLADGTLIADLLIQGVHCAACTWLIENTLTRLPGVLAISVNPVTTRAELHWDPRVTRLAPLMAEIEQIGYVPTPFTEQESYEASEKERRLALRRLLVAGLGMMQVSSYAVALYAGAFQGMDATIQEFLRYISLLVATPVVLYSGAPFFAGAWRNVRSRHMGMDVPVALAIGAAWAASVWNTFAGSGEVFFDSATMFVFFLSGTRYLEAAGRRQALDVTSALAQHIPCTAARVTADGTEEVGVIELETGDRVRVVPGLAFPADGILERGSTSVDESMLTGESAPVRRNTGDAVVAGTVNLGDPVIMRIDKTGADTVLAQIGRLVTMAGNSKPQLVQLTDRIASVFVSVVLLLAAGTAAVWWTIDATRVFEIVLTVLVVTCPCALALATPAAFTVATSSLARRGFLIRKPGALQALASVDRVVFDKTGTLTSNQLQLRNTTTSGKLSKDEALAIAAALEANSAHPIARAFRQWQSDLVAADVRSVPGGGLEGLVAGKRYRIGAAGFAASGADVAEAVSGERVVCLGGDGGLLARFSLHEELRDGSKELFRQLAAGRIGTFIASGDQPAAVAGMAQTLGAEDWHAAMLPEDKLSLIRAMQDTGAKVAVVGDGVNDAPVLAGADVSIAMGSGTSVAQHSADCVWMGSQLTGLGDVFAVARRTMRIVKQNLAWALGYNTLAIPLAVTGSIEPWMAALGMSLSSLLVMLNALRLGRLETTATPPEEPVKSCCSKQAQAAT